MAIDEKKMQEIAKRYDELPEDIQKAYFSSETSDSIFEVGKKHGLVIDKMGELADETGLVMLGMTKPSEYIRNLEKRLGVEVIKAKEIAEDINQKVFSPIRESLKKIHGIPHPPTPSPYKGEGGIGEKPTAPLLNKEGVGRGISPPENLPVEPDITPPEIPPPYERSARGNVEEVKDKIDQILKNHEAAKQARRISHVMPPQPDNIKVGEIAKEIEQKVEVKPLISGRIEESVQSKIEPLRKISNLPQAKQEVPDIFLKKFPQEEKPKISPDFVPPPKEQLPQGPREAKNLLEQELVPSQPPPKRSEMDQYKEPVE